MHALVRTAVALAPVAALAASAPTALAQQTTSPSFNCRASVFYVVAPAPFGRNEPLVANGTQDAPNDRPFCADDDARLPQLTTATPFPLSAKTPIATTAVEPDGANPRDQTAVAGVAIADVSTTIGGLALKANAVSAGAVTSCIDGAPRAVAQSSIGALSVNGQAVDLNAPVTQITTVVNGSPLAGLVRIVPNAVLDQGTATTDSQVAGRQALHVDVLGALGATPLLTAVLGEAKVSRTGAACAAAPTGPTGDTGASGSTGTSGTTGTGGGGPGGGGTGGGGTGGGTGTGSGTGTPQEIQLNGTNGGCGRLRMFFVKGRRTSLKGVFGTRYVTRGKLVDCAGTKSIVGAKIDVYHVVNGTTKRLVKTGIKSRGNGALTLILPLNLTQRKIVFEYRGNLASNVVSSRQTLSYTPVSRKTGRIVK